MQCLNSLFEQIVIISCVRVARLFFFVFFFAWCFVDRCLSFVPFSFGHCVVCPVIYGFWLPLWYILTFLKYTNQCILFFTFISVIHYTLYILKFISDLEQLCVFAAIPTATLYCIDYVYSSRLRLYYNTATHPVICDGWYVNSHVKNTCIGEVLAQNTPVNKFFIEVPVQC